MKNSSPFFSVVLPTFNRAQYLPFAIQSVIDQTFGDFELVISNNQSSDNTEEVVYKFNDPRIRYFKTSDKLSMLENWKFALNQARGEFVTFLGDDDANSIAALELVKESLDNETDCRLLGWQLCQYYWRDQLEPEGKISKDTLVYSPFSGRLLKIDSRQSIKGIFASQGLVDDAQDKLLHNELPSLMNAVYHRSIISEINKQKYFFHPYCIAGDRYNAVVSLHQTREFFYLDYPLHLHGFSGDSATSSFDTSRNSFRNSSEPMLTKVKSLTHRNYSANALLHSKADLGADLDYIEIDWLRFFAESYDDLVVLKKRGFPVEEDLENFREVLAAQTAGFQEQFRSLLPSKNRVAFNNFIYRAKNKLRSSYRALGLNKLNNSLRLKFDRRFYIYLNGQDTGRFLDIAECAKMMDKDWLKKNQS